MTPQELRDRVRHFAYRCVHVCEALPSDRKASRVIADQLIRSSLSASQNYRATNRAQSQKQFYAKLRIALEEADETHGWLEAIYDLKLLPAEKLEGLVAEALELVKILAASKTTLKQKLLAAKKNRTSHISNRT